MSNNLLTSLVLPGELPNLETLNLSSNRFENLDFLEGIVGLGESLRGIDVGENALTRISLPEGMTKLESLRIKENPLKEVRLKEDMEALTELDLSGNQLTEVTLPAGLPNLELLGRHSNHTLERLSLPGGLESLAALSVTSARLRNLSLPAGLRNLRSIRENFQRFGDPAQWRIPGRGYGALNSAHCCLAVCSLSMKQDRQPVGLPRHASR